MRCICIFNQKGGVGKTTTNINLCTFLAMKGYKILTIDIDPQGNTTSGFGIDKNILNKSLYNVLIEENSLEEVIISSELLDNIDIAPSTMELAGAEVEMINRVNRENILKREINKIKDRYDFIFIDCPPSLGILTINALTAAHSVLIPIQCEFYALEGVGQLLNTYNLVKRSLNSNLEIEGVILTMFDNRTRLCNEVANEVKKYFQDKIYDSVITRNIRLAEAPSYGLPIALYDQNCKGAECFKNVTNEFLKRQKRR